MATAIQMTLTMTTWISKRSLRCILYKKLLRMEDAGAGGKRQRQVKFGRLSDDVWPDGETLNQAKRKSIPRVNESSRPRKTKAKSATSAAGIPG
jgi:hypothetical protein